MMGPNTAPQLSLYGFSADARAALGSITRLPTNARVMPEYDIDAPVDHVLVNIDKVSEFYNASTMTAQALGYRPLAALLQPEGVMRPAENYVFFDMVIAEGDKRRLRDLALCPQILGVNKALGNLKAEALQLYAEMSNLFTLPDDLLLADPMTMELLADPIFKRYYLEGVAELLRYHRQGLNPAPHHRARLLNATGKELADDLKEAQAMGGFAGIINSLRSQFSGAPNYGDLDLEDFIPGMGGFATNGHQPSGASRRFAGFGVRS